ncbi:MAG: hypothetical protein WCK94_03045 [Comamonadaceae bacterium]
MQVAQIHQRRQNFLFEADPVSVYTVAAFKNQLLDVVKAFLVAPQNPENFYDVLMLLTDDCQLMIDARLPGLFVQRRRPGPQLLFGVADDREATKLTVVLHV